MTEIDRTGQVWSWRLYENKNEYWVVLTSSRERHYIKRILYEWGTIMMWVSEAMLHEDYEQIA